MLIHHFVSEGWETKPAGSLEADLEFLSRVARKVDTIRDDLGSVGPVLAAGGRAQDARPVAPSVDRLPTDDRSEAARALNRIERNLRDEVARLREQLDASVDELGLTPDAVERVVQTALELARQPALRPATLVRDADPDFAARVFEVPALTRSWALAAADVVDPLTGRPAPRHLRPRRRRRRRRRRARPPRAPPRGPVASASCAPRSGPREARFASDASALVPPTSTNLSVVAHARLVVTGGDGHRLHEEVIQAGGRISRGRFARYNVGQVRDALPPHRPMTPAPR